MKKGTKNKKTKKAKQTISLSKLWDNFLQHRITQFVLLLIIIFVFIGNSTATFDQKINLNGDNIYYFSLGKALSEGKGYTNTMGFEETPHTHFPPGYPVFLAGLMKVFPNDIITIKTANEILLLISIIILFFLLIKLSGSVIVAFITSLLCTMHADLLGFSTMMMSEILYLFVTISVIYLAILLNNRKLFLKKEVLNTVLYVLLLVLIIYAYFVRSIGMSIIIAVVLWTGITAIQSLVKWLKIKKDNPEKTSLITSERRLFIQRVIVCCTIIISFSIARTLWNERNEKAGNTSGYSTQFMKKADNQKMETLNDWTTRIKSNLSNYIALWIPGMVFFTSHDSEQQKTPMQWICGILLFSVMLVGLIRLKEGGLLLFFYMAAYMGVMLLYFEEYQGSRYTLALIPFFIFLFLNGLSSIIKYILNLTSQKSNYRLFQDAVIILVAAFIMIPSYMRSQETLREMAKMKSWDKIHDPRMNHYLEASKWCGNNLSDTTRVLCRKPELFYMFSNYHHAGSIPHYADVDSIVPMLTEKNATHIIIDSWYRHAYITIYPAVIKYPEKFKVIHKIGEVDTIQKLNPTFILEFNPNWGYYGERINGKKEGNGYEFYQDGRKYVGHFSNDLPNGYGEIYNRENTLLAKGKWKNGVLTEPE